MEKTEELDKYKAVALKLTEENKRLNSVCLQLQSSELKQHLEKVNCERENFKLRKALEEVREIASVIINGKHITNDIEGHLKELSKQIIEKTNEVLK